MSWVPEKARKPKDHHRRRRNPLKSSRNATTETEDKLSLVEREHSRESPDGNPPREVRCAAKSTTKDSLDQNSVKTTNVLPVNIESTVTVDGKGLTTDGCTTSVADSVEIRLNADATLESCREALEKSKLSHDVCDSVAVVGSQETVECNIESKAKCDKKSSKRRFGILKKKKTGRREGTTSCEDIQLDVVFQGCDVTSDDGKYKRMDGKRKKKVHVKRFAKTTGKRLWKGVRVSCKFLWSGLILYAKPFGAMDMNIAKAWEEKYEYEKQRQFYNYNDRPANPR